MSDKRMVDPFLDDVMARCSRLDRISNDIHLSLRAGRRPSFETPAVLDEIAGAADLCAQLTRWRATQTPSLDGPMHAVSFTLRAAHEALDALIAADRPVAPPSRAGLRLASNEVA